MAKMQGSVLLAGLEPSVESRVRVILSAFTIDAITSMDDFLERLESLNSENTLLMICGPALPNVNAIELSQSLKVQVKGRPIYYVSTEKQRADDNILLKNGFDQTFFLPFDGILLDRTLRLLLEEHSESELDFKHAVHLSVPITDFKPESVVDFDLMALFPLNQKYIRICKAGGVVRKNITDNLVKHGITNIFIRKTDEAKFNNYYKSQSSNSNRESQLSAKTRAQAAIQKIFHNMLAPGINSFEQGNLLLQKSQAIITDIVSHESFVNVFDGFFRYTGQDWGNYYEQSFRVSAYASIFSLGLKMGKPEDLAIAGLFHHIGLLFCPEEILYKTWEEMNVLERSIYAQHPEDAIKLIMEKRIVLVPEVQTAILEHHEKPDGSGFPLHLTVNKISVEAALLSLASEFDELTSLHVGKKILSPQEAIQKLIDGGYVSFEIANQVKKLLSKPAAPSS